MSKIHRLTEKAVKDGILVQAENCEYCQAADKKLVKHHKDYGNPLDVTWLCYRCHRKEHLENPDLRNPEVLEVEASVPYTDQEQRRLNIKARMKSLNITAHKLKIKSKYSGITGYISGRTKVEGKYVYAMEQALDRLEADAS